MPPSSNQDRIDTLCAEHRLSFKMGGLWSDIWFHWTQSLAPLSVPLFFLIFFLLKHVFIFPSCFAAYVSSHFPSLPCRLIFLGVPLSRNAAVLLLQPGLKIRWDALVQPQHPVVVSCCSRAVVPWRTALLRKCSYFRSRLQPGNEEAAVKIFFEFDGIFSYFVGRNAQARLVLQRGVYWNLCLNWGLC